MRNSEFSDLVFRIFGYDKKIFLKILRNLSISLEIFAQTGFSITYPDLANRSPRRQTETRTCMGVSSAKSFSFNSYQDESYTLHYRSHNSNKTITSRVNYSIWNTFVFNFEKKTLRNHYNFVMAQPLVSIIVRYCTIVHTDYIIYLSLYKTIFIRTPRKMCSP